MNKRLTSRRNFLGSLVGGLSVAAAVRTFPFRVFSFPREIVVPGSYLTVKMIRNMAKQLKMGSGFPPFMIIHPQAFEHVFGQSYEEYARNIENKHIPLSSEPILRFANVSFEIQNT